MCVQYKNAAANIIWRLNMAKLYALFKSENDALAAIDKIENQIDNVKITFFDTSSKSPTEEIFPSDTHIIGSPSSMVSNQLSQRSNPYLGTYCEIGFFPFYKAGFVATCENSLASSEKENVFLPTDAYGAGLKLTGARHKLNAARRILSKNGAGII